MKKLLIVLMSFCGILSTNVLAVEEIIVTGYPPPTWSGLMSGFAAPVPTTSYSTTYSVEAYAQMIAAQKAGEAAAKKKYCKDNNYPTSAPFCAALKAEADAHKKFCAEYPVEVDLAVYKCSLDASSYRDYFVGRYCDSGESGTWNFSASIKNASVSFGTDIKSGGFCREDASNALETSRLRCQYSGMVVQNAVKKQCSDVN